jgi:ankyrin repeat protein
MDSSGFFALKYAMVRRNDDEINKLVRDHNANVNQVDGKGRNMLHHAVNLSSATADASFDTEQTLLDLGININLRDAKNRTPLHYAFVKISDWNNKTQVDPIETVSRLCGCGLLEIDVPDKWQKTPLHYASQRGASICALYLQKRGANLEAIDIYGNSPLGVAMISNHHHFAILLIQTKADVSKLVHMEDP